MTETFEFTGDEVIQILCNHLQKEGKVQNTGIFQLEIWVEPKMSKRLLAVRWEKEDG